MTRRHNAGGSDVIQEEAGGLRGNVGSGDVGNAGSWRAESRLKVVGGFGEKGGLSYKHATKGDITTSMKMRTT